MVDVGLPEWRTVIRMEDIGTPKLLLNIVLRDEKCLPHKPNLKFKNCIKTSLKKTDILERDGKENVTDWERWKKNLYDGRVNFEMAHKNHEKLKRGSRKGCACDTVRKCGWQKGATMH